VRAGGSSGTAKENKVKAGAGTWPEIPFTEWQESCQTLHLYTQVVGKIRLAQTPWVNHSWHTPLYVTVNGLSTRSIPYGRRAFEIEFDFNHQQLVVRADDGRRRDQPLLPRSVADFYALIMDMMASLDIDVQINSLPNELPDPLPLDKDTEHKFYDPDAVHRFWRVLLQSDRVFKQFRTGFLGKVSPVHFFWGSFDLAVTRFSGRPAPPHPGGFPNLPDSVTREAYSHEVSSAGFWPGGGPTDYAAYYSYAYPTPQGFDEANVGPEGAFFLDEAGEFLLPYDVVRTAKDPDVALLEFLQTTYEAAAEAAGWDRQALECEPGRPGVPRSVR
jgi:hypothetical protein